MTALLFSVLSQAEEVIYNKGTVNISCSCEVQGTADRYEWLHKLEIPEDNYYVDFNEVCENSASEYPGAKKVCTDSYDGIEYSFEIAQ